ncbi:MAG: type II secretion system protein N, partial [Terriglobales bacterium]
AMIARRTALALVFACVVYMVTLVATIPAPWISRLLEYSSNQGFLLRDPTGTAWSGSAVLYARLRSGELLSLGLLRWRSSPSAVFTGHLAADLALGANAAPMHVELARSGVAVRGLSLDLPGRILVEVAPALAALGPQGTLRIRSDDLRIDAGSVFGLAEIEWRQVRFARTTELDLGSHVARLRGGGRKVDIEFGSNGGPLRMSGGGAWTRDSGLAVSGTLEHGDDQPAVASFLQSVCSEYRGGRCTFRIKQ